MTTLLRRKACKSCADAKRSCDKQLPKCRRCLSKSLKCEYPHFKKQHGYLVATDAVFSDQLPLPDPDLSSLFALPQDLETWMDANAFGGRDFDALGGVENDALQLPGSLGLMALTQPIQEEYATASLPLWFLRAETWALHHGRGLNKKTVCEFEAVIRWARGMLDHWVLEGSNNFIHSRLYAAGMPKCMQDALTTLSAYNNCTPVMRNTILQIAEDRASELVLQNPAGTESAEGLLALLSRVQALYILIFIRLFDESLRSKAVVEQHVVVLRRWMMQLWEAARRYRGEDSMTQQTDCLAVCAFEAEHEKATVLWRKWILAESIRRSHLVMDLTLTVHETMSTGWYVVWG
jgi:hypothetical protein